MRAMNLKQLKEKNELELQAPRAVGDHEEIHFTVESNDRKYCAHPFQ
jgi:hypothetical protein